MLSIVWILATIKQDIFVSDTQMKISEYEITAMNDDAGLICCSLKLDFRNRYLFI